MSKLEIVLWAQINVLANDSTVIKTLGAQKLKHFQDPLQVKYNLYWLYGPILIHERSQGLRLDRPKARYDRIFIKIDSQTCYQTDMLDLRKL